MQTFLDLKRISLTSFINKVISRVVHDNLEKILPFFNSPNEFGFVKGRRIWYSILINGQPLGFIHYTRGVKQGDPLSHALFILIVVVLSRSLNNMFKVEW